MSSPQDENIRSVLQLVAKSSGNDEKGRERLLYRTLGGPKELPLAVQKIEQISAVKKTLPKRLQPIADEQQEILKRALIATTSIKGAFMTLITTQKSEFKINDPSIKRTIQHNIMRGGGDYQ